MKADDKGLGVTADASHIRQRELKQRLQRKQRERDRAAGKPRGFVVYQGPSLIDGKPIVAVVLTGNRSSNTKTGDLIASYILRADVDPVQARKTGDDQSICGNCKLRPINAKQQPKGALCYVNVGQAPLAVWRAFKRGNYPTDLAAAAAACKGRKLRIGSYGDGAAVPVAVWQALLAQAAGHTAYTHAWRNAALPEEQRQGFNRIAMASVDSAAEAAIARGQGLRYFRLRQAAEPLQQREIICPASAEAGSRVQCARCTACSGLLRKPHAASIVIIDHGPRRARKSSAAAEPVGLQPMPALMQPGAILA